MTQEEIKRMYQGDFKPSIWALYERLRQYYKDTPSTMHNRVAYLYWCRFLRWCEVEGFTREDVNKAKRMMPPEETEQ